MRLDEVNSEEVCHDVTRNSAENRARFTRTSEDFSEIEGNESLEPNSLGSVD